MLKKCTNFLYKKRAQLSILSNEHRGLHEYFKDGKIAWRLGLRPEPRWGSLQRSPDFQAGGERLAAHPQEPCPRCWPFGPRYLGLWPLFSRHLSSNPEYAPAKPLELSVFKLLVFTVVIVGEILL